MNHALSKEELTGLYNSLSSQARENTATLIKKIVAAKQRGGKVVVVTGSGPNIHEGVTTLLAELIAKGVVDGVLTSSAVVAHEMAGALDRVKRVSGELLPVSSLLLPRGSLFEATIMSTETLKRLQREMIIDIALIERVLAAKGEIITKAAGNMAYPVGLRTERIAVEVESIAHREGIPFEEVAGFGADEHTMIGAGARRLVPVLVSVPQLIGGGMVGLAIGDSIPLKRRSALIAKMLADADVIIESGIALSQEIHDGPFETYTGHGIWAGWDGTSTYSLAGKTLARIDLDENLQTVWSLERQSHEVQDSINKGLPKTKTFKVPFRMEMSGFARLEGSIPIIADLGIVWPIVAAEVAESLAIRLDFISAPQESERGRAAREWIVENVSMLDRENMVRGVMNRQGSLSTKKTETAN
ncbi:MAG TPA: hypothetical protein VMV68_02360 [Spirochaetia bacterium]|nr:hypothetical protein [Spirochaetia bacterium]